MKNILRFAPVTLAIVLVAGINARAQKSPRAANYSFSCNASTPLSVTLVSFNFDMQNALNLGSQSSGAGAGKVTFNPLTVKFKADGADARQLLEDIQAGSSFTDCTLTETLLGASPLDVGIKAGSGTGPTGKSGSGSNSSIQWHFRAVMLKDVTFIGSDSSDTDSSGSGVPTAFIQVSFEYGEVAMQ